MISPLTPTSLSQGKLFGDKPKGDLLEYELGFARSARQRAAFGAWQRSVLRTILRRTAAALRALPAAPSRFGKAAHAPRTAIVPSVLLLVAAIASGIAGATGLASDDGLNTSSIAGTVPQELLGASAEPATRVAASLHRGDALAQIRTLVEHSGFEEQWAHLPAHDLWIEIGVNEKANAEGAEVETDSDLLTGLMTGFDRIDLYHFHPHAYFDDTVWSGMPAGDVAADQLETVGLALPSPADVESSMKAVLLASSIGSKAQIRHFVISPLGVVSYGPTARGGKRLVADYGNPRSSVGQESLVSAAHRRGPVNIAKTRDGKPGLPVGGLLDRLTAQMTGDNYAMSFEPHPED